MTVSGSRPDPSLTERERRLDEAIAEYLVAAESGRAPDRRKFLAQYPDLAEDLAAFFQDEECVRGLAGTVPMSGKDGSRRTPSGALIAGELDLLGVGGEFGDFELLEEIASGGMGIVFRARQKSLNRVVALKTIRPSAFRAGDDAAQRFRLEAEAVARLDHPGIVPIFEMGELGGYPFLCLKLIEGGDLDRHRERFRNDPAAAAQMTAEVSRAVHYAHQRGILHRDLKPSNILLDEHGRPHVTDFGLARCLEEDSCLTQTGQIVGTPSYMAPEQVSGPRSALTTAADVYGLGAVLYTLLAGRPPFKGDSVYETLRQVREQEPVAPGTLSAGVDRDLEAICLKCLEKDPRGRYPSAEALAVDLERWLAGEPIVARPAGRAERAWRWYRRNRLIANVSVGVALLIVAFAAVAGIAAVGYYLEAGRAVLAVDAETKAKNLAKAQAEAFRENLVRLAVAGGIRVMDQGDTTGALPWFAEALMYDKDDENAAAAHRLRLGILLGQCPTLDGIFSDGRPITWATFDPTGRRVATASADGIARVWEVATGEAVTPELVHDGPVNRAEFRGDGGRLVTASDDGSVRVWDLDGKRPATDPALRLEHGAPVNFVHFTFDGRRVISGGADGTLRLWIAANGTPAGPTQRIGTPLVDLVQSTDGRTLATASEDGSSQLWRLDGRGLHAVGALAPSRVRRVALSPDGTKLATASAVGMARVWDARTGAPITPPLTHGHWISQTEFSPDGKWLATASEDGTARVWDARTGRPIGSGSATISHVAGVNEVSFSPDGARLVTAGLDGTARIWDVDSRLPLSPPFFHGGSLRRARFSPDGYHLLTVGSDSTARLWDVSRMGGSALEIEDPAGVGYAAFDPTGGRIATAGNGGAALVWNAETGEAVSQPMRHRRTIVRVAFSTDGQRVATASKDGMARVWDAGTGRPVTYALAHDGPVRDVRFSRDGTRLATASADGRARLWDVATSKNAVPPMEHGKAVNAVAFSPDGRWLATASDDGTARIWEVTSGQPARTPLEHGAPVTCVDFRPDGRALLTACSDENFTELQAQQWNLETGKPLGVAMKHRDGVLWAVYSPDGRRIATASEDRTARVWDSFGEPVIGPLTHQHQVLKVAFSPDGRRLASCSLDGTARVWDVATGEPLSPPLLHRDHTRVGSVAFSPDDGRLLTAGMDGMARVWELLRDERPADLLVLNAQALAGRRLYQAGAVFHTGAEIPLTASELQDAWRRLRDSDPTGRQAGSQSAIRSRIAWHRREARRLELGHQGTAAAWHLSRLHELQPGDASLDARLAAAYEMAADWEGLNRSASRAIAGGSSDVEVGIRRGWARLYLGWPADAATDFRHALKQEPRSAAIRLGLFAATAEMDNPEEADALWRDVMNDHDESRPERWADVAAHLARLARARSESWGFCRASGHAQLRAGSAEQSEADYNRALQIKPNDAWSYLGRGLARKKLGRLDGALVDLARAVELEPRMAASWRLRGEIHGVRRQWDEAARDFAHWAEVGGEPSALFWYDHAALRLQVRDHDGYRRTCMAMWECFGRSDDPAVAGYVARACVLGPDPGIPTEKVIDLARQGVQVHPRSGWDLSTLGAALLRAGRFKDGLAQLDEAAKVEPGWIGIPLIEALRDMALRGRAGHEPPTAWTTADRKAEGRSSVDFSKIIGRMLKAKAPWNLGLEAELLVREHDEGRSGPQAKPGP